MKVFVVEGEKILANPQSWEECLFSLITILLGNAAIIRMILNDWPSCCGKVVFMETEVCQTSGYKQNVWEQNYRVSKLRKRF